METVVSVPALNVLSSLSGQGFLLYIFNNSLIDQYSGKVLQP